MNELSLHIEYLLRRHDCVIVPGIGAFKADTEAARYDEERSQFLPPCRRITFNAAINTPGDLLAHSYARRAGVPFEQGKVLLKTCVDNLKGQLASGSPVNIEGVGTLVRNDEGRLSFTTAARAVKETSLYAPIALSVAKPIEIERVIKTNPRYYYFKVNKALLNSAAAILVALVSAFSIAKVVSEGSEGMSLQNFASVLPLTNSVEEPRTEEHEILIAMPREEESSPAPAEVLQATDEGVETTSSKKYHLIVATFHSGQEAEIFMSQHATDTGVKLTDISGGKLHRIAAASADDMEQLTHMQRDKEFAALYPQSWIYTAKAN